MSKTWKTRPLKVRMGDKNDHGVDISEHHDHRHGECDLPDSHLDDDTGHKCFYTYEYNGHGLHSCSLCTDKDGRKANRKRERSNIRKTLKKDISSL